MKLRKDKTYFIDLDGTLYSGNQVLDGAIAFLTQLQKEKIAYFFITNNATRTRKQNVEKLEELGFSNIREQDFFTSGMASASYIAHHSEARRAFYIGQDGLKEALLEQGFVIEEETADFVFVGLDTNATYQQYCHAFSLLQKGAKLIGTNQDRRLPHGDGFWIGNGAIVAMFAYASGQEPLLIGKPCKPMMEEALRFAGISKEDCIVIGDNLETDILFGIQHDVETIFVTTGVHQEQDMGVLDIHPTHIISNLKELI